MANESVDIVMAEISTVTTLNDDEGIWNSPILFFCSAIINVYRSFLLAIPLNSVTDPAPVIAQVDDKGCTCVFFSLFNSLIEIILL